MAHFPSWSHHHTSPAFPLSSPSVFSPPGHHSGSRPYEPKPIFVALPPALYKQPDSLEEGGQAKANFVVKPFRDIQDLLKHLDVTYFYSRDFSLLKRFSKEFLMTAEGRSMHGGTLKHIVQWANKLYEYVPEPLQLLQAGSNDSVKLRKTQIASLLANAFLCTYPDRKEHQGPYASYPSINFSSLFWPRGEATDKTNIEKLKCLFSYFRSLARKMVTMGNVPGSVEFTRVVLRDKIHWDQSTLPMTKFHMESVGATFEDSTHITVDFANKRIGGGVISRGCVQEEIRFITCPELIVARLFTEELGENEALVIRGIEQYCKFTGYQQTFKYDGEFCDDPRKAEQRVMVCIDALDFSREDKYLKGRVAESLTPVLKKLFRGREEFKILKYANTAYEHGLAQYSREAIDRELNKAYIGFCCKKVADVPADAHIATGNWGGGCFKGDPILKAKIQHLAASQAERELHYYPYGSVELQKLVSRNAFHGGTVQSCYNDLMQYANTRIKELVDEADRPWGKKFFG